MPLTTAEVAEEFNCTDRTIYNKLDALVNDGLLKTKKVGARGRCGGNLRVTQKSKQTTNRTRIETWRLHHMWTNHRSLFSLVVKWPNESEKRTGLRQPSAQWTTGPSSCK